MTESVPEQVLHEPVFGAALVALGGGTRADQVAQRFVRRIRDPDARQRPAREALRELLRVPTIVLILSPGFRRISDGATTSQSMPIFVSCQYNTYPVGPAS